MAGQWRQSEQKDEEGAGSQGEVMWEGNEEQSQTKNCILYHSELKICPL